MGRGRHRRRLAEGADAAAGPGLQRASATKALAASRSAELPNSYWAWDEMLGPNKNGFFPYTPGDQPALRPARGASTCCSRRGWTTSSPATRRHARGDAPRGARLGPGDPVRRTGRIFSRCSPPCCMPEGHDADAFRKVVLEHFDMSLGTGLGKVKGKVFRIGHLGDFNDLTLMGTLAGVEMGLELAGVPTRRAASRRPWTICRAQAAASITCMRRARPEGRAAAALAAGAVRDDTTTRPTTTLRARLFDTAEREETQMKKRPTACWRGSGGPGHSSWPGAASAAQIELKLGHVGEPGLAVRPVRPTNSPSAPTPSWAARPRSSSTARASSAATRRCCRSSSSARWTWRCRRP